MTYTFASALVALVGVLVSILIALDSRRHTKEANQIAKEKADESNAINKAIAESSNHKLDKANTLNDVANQKLEDANEISRSSIAQLMESNRLMGENLKIQRDVLEFERARDSVMLEIAHGRWHYAHPKNKPPLVMPAVSIRCLGRTCRIERVSLVSDNGEGLIDLDSKRLPNSTYEQVFGDSGTWADPTSIEIHKGHSIDLHGTPALSIEDCESQDILDATRLHVLTSCGQTIEGRISPLRAFLRK